MATSSPETAARGRWGVTNHPLGSEGALEAFESKKGCVKIALGEDATKLANAFDQVRAKGEAAFLKFAYSNLTPEQSKKQAASLLNTRDLLRNVQGLAPEVQTRFIDKVDQVSLSCLIRLSHVHPSSSLRRRTLSSTREP